MNERHLFRIRIARADAPDLFFINVMSPSRALTTVAEDAQLFSSETSAMTMAHGIVTAQGGDGSFFFRLRPMLFTFGAQRECERADVTVEFARKFSNGKVGAWNTNRRGGLIVKNPRLAMAA